MWLDEIEELIRQNEPFKDTGPMYLRHEDTERMARVIRELAKFIIDDYELDCPCDDCKEANDNLSDDAKAVLGRE